MKALVLSAAAAVALTLTAGSPAFAAKKVVIIKSGHHDNGLHRGWSHSPHWGARYRGARVVIHR